MVIAYLLFITSGIVKASGDICLFHYDRSVFKNLSWFNPRGSWMNKYKADLKTPLFPFSTTALVIFTDWLHLHRAIDFLLIMVAMFITPFTFNSIYIKIFVFLSLWACRNISFEIAFRYIFKK